MKNITGNKKIEEKHSAVAERLERFDRNIERIVLLVIILVTVLLAYRTVIDLSSAVVICVVVIIYYGLAGSGRKIM